MQGVFKGRKIKYMDNSLTKKCISRRVGATIIDYTIVWIFVAFYTDIFGVPNDLGGKTVSGFSAMVPVLFWFIYIVLAERYLKGTLGHLIFKIKIESTTKESISLIRTFVRRIADILDITCTFGLLAFLLAKNTNQNQRLGDILAKTIVVRVNDSLHSPVFDFDRI